MNTDVPILNIKSKTWHKDSHSLFDYQSEKVSEQVFQMEMPPNEIAVFRKKNSPALKVTQGGQYIDENNYDIVTHFRIKQSEKQGFYKLQFADGQYLKKTKNNQQFGELAKQDSYSGLEPKQSSYFVVRKFVDNNGSPLGFKLNAGQTVKLGRVEYFVSEICFGGKVTSAISKNKATVCNRSILKYQDQPKNQAGEVNPCKFCLEEVETEENFLLSPCKCTGSCGSVHIQCLQEWIHMKVKKEVVGGTKQFNYQKFQCEVCKTEFPMIIEKQGKNMELLPLEKPSGNYLILEAACEKTKSVMLITNLGLGGIKLGRGHQCQIRITDISVSRNHALIKNTLDGFYIYDNKSKFGTLVKGQGAYSIEVGSLDKQIQIGRTVINLSFPMQKTYT